MYISYKFLNRTFTKKIIYKYKKKFANVSDEI